MSALRTRVGGCGLAIAATGMLLAGCGGSSPSGQSSSGSARSSAVQAYITCMQQNGVTLSVPSGGPNGAGGSGGPGGVRPSGAMPSGAAPSGAPGGSAPSGGPGGGGGGFLQQPAGVDDATWQKATAACAGLLPGSGTANGADQADQNCLRQHGVTSSASPDAATEQTCSVLKPTATPSS